MIETVWFFVILVAANGHWALDPLQLPVEKETYQECMDYGTSLMVDSRNPNYFLVCIEADDEHDLHKIMLDNFDFGGQGV